MALPPVQIGGRPPSAPRPACARGLCSMHRSARSLVAFQVALLAAALVLPAAVAASAPTTVTLSILDATCSGAPATIAAGDTVCARAVVTVTGTGAGEYRTHWYAPGAFSPTFQDVHALTDAGTYTFDDSHALTTPGVWSVRACRNSSCVSGSGIAATKAVNVIAVVPTTLTVRSASGTYFGTTTLSATLVTTSGAVPVTGATVTFTLPGGTAGSADTDASGVATLADASLGSTGAGSYPAGVGATFAGTSTRGDSAGTGALTIDRAGSMTVVTCTDQTFTGSPLEPCDASAQGAGGLDEPLDVTYGDNTDAGTAHASASFPGDANHEPSDSSAAFDIGRAASAVDVDCPATLLFTGAEQEPCTASVTGAGGLDEPVRVDYADNVLGTAGGSATYDGDGNHTGDSSSAGFRIVFAWSGFDQPLEGRGAGAAVNGFKAGQTIPVKFVIADAGGTIVRQAASPGFARSGNLGSCAAPLSSDALPLSTPGGDTAFAWDGSAYHLNWSTKGLSAGLYRVSAKLADGMTRSADVCLTR